jgi:peptide/nickel transport system ATP-binding protein
MIEAVDLHKAYSLSTGFRALFKGGGREPIKALDGVSFVVENGHALGIVGESGCGKSTLAKVLMGLEQPTSGRFYHNGQDGAAMLAKDRRSFYRQVQMVFQDPFSSLNPSHDVFRIVALPLIYQGVRDKSEIDRRVRQVMETVGLTPVEVYLSKHPHLLSGGQRQRLCIARALLLNPSNLIADEPVSMLDVSVKWGVIRLLKQLVKSRDLSLIYITHDMGTVSRVCDQVAVMYLGRVVEIGETKTVLARPAHPYTKALIAAAPRTDSGNRAKGTLIAGDIGDNAPATQGCSFQHRCPVRLAKCMIDDPALENYEGRNVACWALPPAQAPIPGKTQ